MSPIYFGSEGSIQLDCLGGIQDKITVCATDDSYQKARESMAQVEEETRSRSAIVIKPGGRYVGEETWHRRHNSTGSAGILLGIHSTQIETGRISAPCKHPKPPMCLCSLSPLASGPDGLFGSRARWQRSSAPPACLICNQDFIEFNGGWFLNGQTCEAPHAHSSSFSLNPCNLNTKGQKCPCA